MGLLDTTRLQKIFGRAFSGVYGSGTLVQSGKVRQTNGTLVTTIIAQHPVKVQFDACTEAMRASSGYASTDTRAIILRDGLSLELTQLDSDCYLIGAGFEWNLNEIYTDPARSYYEVRASLRRPATVAGP